MIRPHLQTPLIGTQHEGGGPTEVATLGSGCFWCFDAVARRCEGILSSTTGYAGGPGPAPTYWDVHGGRAPGHVEAVQLVFDPQQIGYSDLLRLFFHSHDPTTPNQDGANFGPEYHSTIFYHSPEQLAIARKTISELQGDFDRPIATSLREFTSFFPAEFEHQDFYNQNPGHPYCRYVIVPKLKKALG